MTTNATFVFPGCFAPPTYGHFRVVQAMSEILPAVSIICSTNEQKEKTRWFDEKACAHMWSHYALRENVEVMTFQDAKKNLDFGRIVMIRGVRDADDLENEKRIMKLNKDLYGIDKVLYHIAENDYANVSATRARQVASEMDFMSFPDLVAPGVVTVLLEKVLRAKNIFMVVGKPAAGKSAFMQAVIDLDPQSRWIDTDAISADVKPLLYKEFGEHADLVKVALEQKERFASAISRTWFDLLCARLQSVPAGKNIFLEVPYGLQPDKEMFRYLGGKIIYVGCEDDAVNRRRLVERGTPHHMPFVEHIPHLKKTEAICKKERLNLSFIDSSGSLMDMRKQVSNFCKRWN